MRLDKFLSTLGHTRSEAKKLCASGRVRVGDRIALDPSVQVEADAFVSLDGRPVSMEEHRHLMLCKPSGVITATRDRGGAPTVLDLVPPSQRRKGLGCVGRLDKDVTGLILLTTDGQLAHRLISPRRMIEKVYRARVEGALREEHIGQMAAGLFLGDFVARPAKLVIRESAETSQAEVTVVEGKYHQVKRMFQAIGCPVIELERLSIGGLTLDPGMKPGEWRALTSWEIARLYALVEME